MAVVCSVAVTQTKGLANVSLSVYKTTAENVGLFGREADMSITKTEYP